MEERITSYLIAIIGIISMMGLWTLVQTYWKKVFTDYITDEDAMADRRSCGNCGCTTACETKKQILNK